jgi:trans-aconitate 2-methyltransferase
MPTWDAKQYLRFHDQRTRPCCDLAERVSIDRPRTVIDLGCGPGNSTAVVAARWPGATVFGIDSSPEMIAAARAECPTRLYRVSDIADWASSGGEVYDVVFSNAALQWVGDHGQLLPQLMKHVTPKGALAIQMPCNYDAPAHVIMRDMAASPEWRSHFSGPVREWAIQDLREYYDILAPCSSSLDLWTSEYIHIMENAEAIVQWYKGTGLRPFLDALPGEADKQRFEAEYTSCIRKVYPARADGRVLFPFERMFIIAYATEAAKGL